MLRILTSKQLSEWAAYDAIEPICGTERLEYSISVLCSVVTNIARAVWGDKGCKMSSPLDFIPQWDVEKRNKSIIDGAQKKQSVEEMKSIMMAITKATSKKVNP